MAPPPPPPPRRLRGSLKVFPTFSEHRRAYYEAADKADNDWVQQRYRDKHRFDKERARASKRSRRGRQRRSKNHPLAKFYKAADRETQVCIQEHAADRAWQERPNHPPLFTTEVADLTGLAPSLSQSAPLAESSTEEVPAEE